MLQPGLTLIFFYDGVDNHKHSDQRLFMNCRGQTCKALESNESATASVENLFMVTIHQEKMIAFFRKLARSNTDMPTITIITSGAWALMHCRERFEKKIELGELRDITQSQDPGEECAEEYAR